MTPTTSTSVMSIVSWMSLNAWRMFTERSWRMPRCTDGGSCASSAGSTARTASATSITFVPGCFCTSSVIARCWKSFVMYHARCVSDLDAVEDVGDLVEPHRPAVAVRDDDLPELVRVVQLPLGHDAVGGLRPEQLSGRLRHVPVLQRRVDLVDADLLRLAACSGSTWTRTAYFAAPCTVTCDTPFTIEMRGARMSSAYSSTFVMSRRVGRQVDLQDRLIGRILLAERRRRRQRRRQQRHRGGDRRLHVGDRAVDVAVQIERQRDVRVAGAAARRHLVDAGNRRELPLERARDRRRHRHRIAAGQIRRRR